MRAILDQIAKERERQDIKWGQQNHENGYWLAILMEEVGEVAKAIVEGSGPSTVRTELIHVAAVCVSWLECMDRRRR